MAKYRVNHVYRFILPPEESSVDRYERLQNSNIFNLCLSVFDLQVVRQPDRLIRFCATHCLMPARRANAINIAFRQIYLMTTFSIRFTTSQLSFHPIVVMTVIGLLLYLVHLEIFLRVGVPGFKHTTSCLIARYADHLANYVAYLLICTLHLTMNMYCYREIFASRAD